MCFCVSVYETQYFREANNVVQSSDARQGKIIHQTFFRPTTNFKEKEIGYVLSDNKDTLLRRNN